MAGTRRNRVVASTPDCHVDSVTKNGWTPPGDWFEGHGLATDLPVPPGLLHRPRYRLGVGKELVEFGACLVVVEACVSKPFVASLMCRGSADGVRCGIGEPAGTEKADAVHGWHSCWQRTYNIPA
jgi:hypothetical protein